MTNEKAFQYWRGNNIVRSPILALTVTRLNIMTYKIVCMWGKLPAAIAKLGSCDKRGSEAKRGKDKSVKLMLCDVIVARMWLLKAKNSCLQNISEFFL